MLSLPYNTCATPDHSSGISHDSSHRLCTLIVQVDLNLLFQSNNRNLPGVCCL